MKKVTKNGYVFGVSSDDQLQAFLNSGWVEVGKKEAPKTVVEKPKVAEKDEAPKKSSKPVRKSGGRPKKQEK